MAKHALPIICLLPGPQPPVTEAGESEFWYLSECLSGAVLCPVWSRDHVPSDGSAYATVGNFEFYTICNQRLPSILRVVANIVFYVRRGLALHRQHKYVAIVAYGPFTTAWAGFVLKLLTGAPLIVDFPGNPLNSFLLNRPRPGVLNHLKTLVSRVTSPLVAKVADHLRLLFPTQLQAVVNVPLSKVSAFHYFTTIRGIKAGGETRNYILCLGGPWYRKGVDVLIKAFLTISDEFPELTLRLIGYGDNKEYFEALASSHRCIEFMKPLPHRDAMEQIQHCRILACPSRSEGFPRVIVEAMAAGRPVIASAVDGIPHYIQDGITGLLTASESVESLASAIRQVLIDSNLANRLGTNARAYAMDNFTEECYVTYYLRMVHDAVGPMECGTQVGVH